MRPVSCTLIANINSADLRTTGWRSNRASKVIAYSHLLDWRIQEALHCESDKLSKQFISQ